MARRRRVDDEVLDALDELCDAIVANARDGELIRRRAETIRKARAEGRSYREIVSDSDGPLVVELVSDKLDRLFKAGSRVRRAEAAALHAEGLSMDRIAEVFGVTRQRVSKLLKPTSRPGSTGRI